MANSENRIEMHCHTVFSPDARCTPEELAEKAAERGVKVLSVTDHNHLGAQDRAAKRAVELGMRYVRGIEIDAQVPQGRNYHFVCFDYNPDDAEFKKVATYNSSLYEPRFLNIFPYLKDYGCDITLDELRTLLPERYPTNPAPTLNTWFARDILLREGIITDKAEFRDIQRDIRQKIEEKDEVKTYSRVTFQEMRDAVHNAGGKVLLAHVARYYRGDMDQQISTIEGLLGDGLDGFELYHPDNVKEPDFARLYDLAKNTDCLLSSGSDCHNALNDESNQHFGNMIVEDWFLERLV